MDDRRRTISSEEQMIGEALMRVSNTLEAQRLTKSLDYQEKLRRRTNIRLIIAIICLCVAFMMLMVGGLLLFVLWRYAEPVLGTVMPFLKKMFGDFGILWDGLVESATYVPVMVEQLTRILESVCVMLDGISKIDLAGMMKYLTNILGTTSGMLSDLRGAMASMMPLLTTMGNSLSKMMAGDISGLNSLLTGMGLDPEVIKGMIKDTVNMMAGLAASGNDLMGGISEMTGAMTKGIKDANMDDIAAETTEFFNRVPVWIDGTRDTLDHVTEAIDPDEAGKMVGQLGEGLGGMATGIQGMGEGMAKLGEMMAGIDTSGGLIGILKSLLSS